MTDVFRLIQAASRGLPVLEAVQRASRGDEEAIRYLKDQGWCDALDALIRPGAGAVARQAVQMVKGYADGSVIEGEYREIDGPAWSGFVKWLRAREWGCFVILGPKGQGKTTLALRLAQVWQERTGYPIIGVNLYPEDVEGLPVQRTGIASFAHVMGKLTRVLEGPDIVEVDETEGSRPDEKDETPINLDSMKRRIIIIDEASLVLHPGGANSGRMTARRAMAQARHLEWLVIYIGQLAQQMPLDMLLAEAVFVKQPAGWEAKADRDAPLVQMLWEKAHQAFANVKRLPEWAEYPDLRSWAYVEANAYATHGYAGLMPYSLPVRSENQI